VVLTQKKWIWLSGLRLQKVNSLKKLGHMGRLQGEKGRAEDPVRPTQGRKESAEARPENVPMETKAYVYRLSALFSGQPVI
jgi:hypothetical protein